MERSNRRPLLLLSLLGVLAGCSGDEVPAAPECTTSETCATAGTLCLEGRCTPCEASAACEADATYADQNLTQCREGLCTACEPGLVGCECVEGACTTGECVDNSCTDCTRGDPSCVCLDNGACNPGALCEVSGLCAECTLGAELCACRDDDSCDDGLSCTDGACVQPTCTDGTLDCACDDGACVGSLYCDDADLCRACSSDIAGCPCDANDECGGDNFCEASICVSCPDTAKPSSCECTASEQCIDGLVCDADDFVCRDPVTCEDAGCIPFQLCEVQTSGSDAGDARCVPETCVLGYTWDAASGSCLPITTPTCLDASGAPSSAADNCAAQDKTCVDGAAGPVCVDTCETLGCALNRRDCTPGATTVDDAVCSVCAPGYVDNAGTCELDPGATCDAASANSIDAICAARNRACVTLTVGAACGDCLGDRAVDPRTDQCVEVEACGEGQCFDGEFCHYPQDGRPPECRVRCPAGMAMTEAGACVSCGAVSCGSGQLHGALVENQCVCEDQAFCSYNVDFGNRCRVSPCGAQEAVSTLGGACTPCNVTCGNSAGETNRVWPWRDQFGGCFCETADDFYQPYGGGATAQACDADEDGWINTTAQNAYESASRGVNNVPDEATLANFRCARRTIDRIRLVNEFGQRRDIGLCGTDGVVLDWAPGQAPPACANGPIEVPLFESDTLESDNLISLDDLQFPSFGSRKLRAAELNALTKACVSADADFNLNGATDLLETQPLARVDVPGASDAELLFRAAAYFVETHGGRYVAPGAGTGPGVYVVEERSRCDTDFPLGYEVTDGYWRSCERKRNSDFDAVSPTASRTTMDFAQFGCPATDGTCALPTPPTTGASNDGDTIVDHDVCALRTAGMLPLADTPWRGMSHHSQFVCAQIGNGTGHHRVASSRLSGPTVVNADYDFNGCGATTCAGQAGCVESTAPSSDTNQPDWPNLTCSYTAGTAVANDAVGFVSARYVQLRAQDPYLRGCVNEAAEYPDLCPGYTANPDAVLVSGNRGDSGKLICGCGLQYGGPSCEFACAQRPGDDGKLHFGGPDRSNLTLEQQQLYGCVDGFCTEYPPVPAESFSGGRRGYWMCGQPKVTRPATANASPYLTATTSAGTVSLSGGISTIPVLRVPMVTTATAGCPGAGCFVDALGNARVVTAY